jgi:hypothetical protein
MVPSICLVANICFCELIVLPSPLTYRQNDLFRDAIDRDSSGDLGMWLTKGSGENGPGRISYAFCDMSSIDDHGDRILDFIPNPRHSLVAWVENLHRQGNSI